jgi:uncharacterized protein (DUF486 family)
MTFAWYAHLKDMHNQPWMVAAFASWGIALFEYLLQVPANRIGFTVMSLPQLKIMQEVIALSVFVPFAVLYMKNRSNGIIFRRGMFVGCGLLCVSLVEKELARDHLSNRD